MNRAATHTLLLATYNNFIRLHQEIEMTQQTFAVGENPRVQITNVDGSLSIQTWQERSISVESTGTLDSLRQDGDTVIISDHTGDLSLFVPAIRNGFRWITTDVSVTHLTGDASIEGAGEVILNDIKGNVTLKNIAGSVDIENVGAVAEVTNVGGNLRATSMPTLLARKGIGGEALVSDVARLEIDAVGGSAELNKVGTATIHAVGGNLDAEGIETSLRCNVVGGDCHVHNSANAEVNITNVGGNLQMEGTLRGHMSNVGGNLHTRMTFPAGSSTHFHVGGNANVEMPDDASVALHAIVGGQVTGDALGSSSSPIYRGSSNFANLVYGDGAAKLSLFAQIWANRGTTSGVR
jgi:hypothetical protein